MAQILIHEVGPRDGLQAEAQVVPTDTKLDWLGETAKGAAIDGAVAEVIKEGRVRTYDMGGSASTLEMSEAIAQKL